MPQSSKESKTNAKRGPERVGDLDSADRRFVIAASRFNAHIVDRLLSGALDALEQTGSRRERVRVIRVPGAFELPQIARRLADSGDYDGIVALGAVIRGETPHFEYVSRAAAEGLERVSLDFGVPIGFGILTTDTPEQALSRAGGENGNRGFDAAMAVVEMVKLLRDI